ncbi:hypothetical protein U1Q18_016526 [Sarracenia purpurea var. burkii]
MSRSDLWGTCGSESNDLGLRVADLDLIYVRIYPHGRSGCSLLGMGHRSEHESCSGCRPDRCVVTLSTICWSVLVGVGRPMASRSRPVFVSLSSLLVANLLKNHIWN